MTPSEVETAARYRYGASTDTFFSQAEIFELIYQAEMVLATRAHCIQALDTSTTTVSGTQSYAFPTNFISVKRVTWNGRWLKKINFNEDDVLTSLSAATTATGEPSFYYIWNNYIYLREIPNAAQTLAIIGFKQPTALSTSPISTSLSVPARYHTGLIDFVVAHMALKDKEFTIYQMLMDRWDLVVKEAERYEEKRKRADSLNYVRLEEQMPTTDFGM